MPVNVEALLLSSVVPALHGTDFTNILYWTKTTLLEWSHEAVQRMARRAAGLVATSSTALVTGEGSYTVPARTLSVLHVAAAGKMLRAANARDLEARNSGDWRAKEDAVITNYVRQDHGLGTVRIYPKPATGLTGTVQITAHLYPPQVTELAPTVAWPDALSPYLALRALEKARMAETDAKMPEVSAIASEICGVIEQVAEQLWGGVQ